VDTPTCDNGADQPGVVAVVAGLGNGAAQPGGCGSGRRLGNSASYLGGWLYVPRKRPGFRDFLSWCIESFFLV